MDIQKLIDDIECARNWLLPKRKVEQIEIDNCISELNDIITRLSTTHNTDYAKLPSVPENHKCDSWHIPKGLNKYICNVCGNDFA